MPTRRKSTPPDIANNPAAVPGVHPPPGTEANVNVRYTIPAELPNYRNGYPDDLADLAEQESENLMPVDPLTEFCEEWVKYAGWSLTVLRLPDSHPRRVPGQMYRRPYFAPTPENLGIIGFDPNPAVLIPNIQAQNGNSGGTFQLWLTDQFGRRVPEALLYSVSLGDPPPGYTQPQAERPERQYIQPAPPPQKSESEMELERMKNDLFRTALNRVLEPPQVVPQPAQLAGEDQAALFLFKHTDFLTGIFTKMADMSKLAEAPAAVGWKERMGEAAVALATQNPAILERVSSVIERIVARILPDPNAPQYAPPPQPVYVQQPPPPQIQAPIQTSVYTPPPTLAQPQALIEDEQDAEDMEILEDVIQTLLSKEPLHPDMEMFKVLQKEYPKRFPAMLALINAVPLNDMIEFIKDKSALYEQMLDPETSTGQHLRTRLGELKAMVGAALKASQNATQ